MRNYDKWKEDYEVELNEYEVKVMLDRDLANPGPYDQGYKAGRRHAGYDTNYTHPLNRKCYALGYCDGKGSTPHDAQWLPYYSDESS